MRINHGKALSLANQVTSISLPQLNHVLLFANSTRAVHLLTSIGFLNLSRSVGIKSANLV